MVSIQNRSIIKISLTSVKVDGVHTAIENVADIVGFEVGYKAYQRHIQRHDPEKDLNAFLDFSHDKWFTLAFANVSCPVAYCKIKLVFLFYMQ